MGRPEFKVKMKIAELYGGFHLFPGQVGVWQMTAAQRTLLLGKPDKEAKSETDRGGGMRRAMPRIPLTNLIKLSELPQNAPKGFETPFLLDKPLE